MTAAERRRFREIIAELPDHHWNTVPKQEAIIEYLRSQDELAEMRQGVSLARQNALTKPNDSDAVSNLSQWLSMTAKIETKIHRLRESVGLNAKKESDLAKSIKAKGAPKGGHEIKPWAAG